MKIKRIRRDRRQSRIARILMLIPLLALALTAASCAAGGDHPLPADTTAAPDVTSAPDALTETPSTDAESTHEHKFQPVGSKLPKCESIGYNIYNCSCGATKIETTADALGHDMADATCTSGAACRRCEVVFGPPLGHTYGEWQTKTPAACEKNGEDSRTCSRCGAADTRYTAPLGHTFEGGSCKTCGAPDPEGGTLDYKLNADSSGYTVIGLGNVSGADVSIPARHNGLPVLGIADAAFEGNQSIRKVTIHAGIEQIGNHAFFGCSALVSINIPDGVTAIGMGAFANCSSLESITLPDSLTDVGSHLFSGCSSLAAAELGGGLSYISDSMFADCKALRSIDIPAQMTAICAEAFSACRAMTSVTLPQALTRLGQNAFAYCTAMTHADLSTCGIKKLEAYSFFGCRALTEIHLGRALENIGTEALGSCRTLTTIRFGGTLAEWSALAGDGTWLDPGASLTAICDDGQVVVASEVMIVP